MMTVGIIVGLLGAVAYLLFARRLDIALVFIALAVVCWRDENMTDGEWWAFGIIFVISWLLLLRTPKWSGRQHIGVGIAMLLLAFVLSSSWSITNPFDNWGWIISILLVVVLALVAYLLFTEAVAVIIAAFLVVAILAVGSLFGFITSPHRGPEAGPKPNTTQSQTAPPTGGATTSTGTATGTPCPSAYVQKPYSRGDKNRMLVNGIATLLPAKGKNATPSEKIDAYLKATGKDATLLAAYAWNEGVWTDANDTKPLVTADGKCLSAQGQKVHDMLEGAWKSGSNLFTNSPTPTNGTNSGISKGKVVVSSHSGMDKGRTGLKVVHPNGRVTFIDDACGNLVFLTAPPKSIPKGPTDQPKLEAKKPAEDSMNNPSRPAQEKGTAPSISSGASAPAAGTPPSTPYKAPAAPDPTATASPSPTVSVEPSATPQPSGDPCNNVPKPSYC